MNSPPKWSSIDSEVQAQVERVRDLHRRSVEATDAARRSAEAVAATEREDKARRSAALAEGAEVDPGADRERIAEAETQAERDAEASAVLADAYSRARSRLDLVADERSEAWATEARKRLDRAAVELGAAVEVVEASYAGWRAARGQLELAENERARRKGGVAPDVPVPGLRAPGGHPILASVVIAALASLAEPEAVEPEPEPLSDDDRRTLVAQGVEIHGPGLG
jgi:hypothetical protein